MKKLLNTLLDIWVLLTIIRLLVAFICWYKKLGRDRKRLYWTLLLLYLSLLGIIGL